MAKRTGTPIHQAANGTWWWVVDVGPKGGPRQQVKRRGFRTQKEAKEALAELRTKVRRGEYVPRSTETFDDFADSWLASRQRDALAPSTRAQYERNLRRHVRPHLGGERIQRIDTPRIERLYDELHQAGVGHGALQSIHTLLKQVFRAAAKQKIIERNPMALVDRPKAPSITADDEDDDFARDHVWTPAELRTFLALAQGSDLYPLLRLAATTGMRRGELCGLRWQDVDLDAATVEVRQQYADARGGGQEFRRLKSKAARRRIDIDSTTVAVLRDHRKAQLENRLRIGEGYRDQGVVFTYPDGEPLRPTFVSKEFRRLAVKTAEAENGGRTPDEPECPVIRFHDLRHTHASALVADGRDILFVAKRLGHSNPSFTLARYGHAIPDDRGVEAAEAFARAIDG